MVTAGDFRNGVTFEMDGKVYQIVEFQHVKPGKGAAFVRTKIRNVIEGSVVERTFIVAVPLPIRRFTISGMKNSAFRLLFVLSAARNSQNAASECVK